MPASALPALHGLFEVHSKPSTKDPTILPSPAPTHQKPKVEARQSPSVVVELDELAIGASAHPNGSKEIAQIPSSPRAGKSLRDNEEHEMRTPNEVEMSRPVSPEQEAVEVVQSWNEPAKNRWRVLSCCLCYLVNGMNDSATGALIPYMEKQYRIQYDVVSIIFVGQAAGFIAAPLFNNLVLRKLGRARMLMLAEAVIIAAYVVLVCTPPYPAVIFAFFLIGYGAAMTLALNNVFCANLHPPSAVGGAAHGSYGIGGIVAPIVATVICSGGTVWSRFYFLPMGLALASMVFSGWAFWDYTEDPRSQALIEHAGEPEAEAKVSRFHDLKRALKNRATVFGALFIFAYQGAEVSISGWVISFLIQYRGGDAAKVGYVTAGFWAGITLGRFLLTHLAPRFGERAFTFYLVALTAGFQLIAWLVPSIITNAVAVAILGLLLGPVYPCTQTVFARLWPRDIQTSAMGFIAGAGSSGGAVAPFTTGMLAQAVGTWVLHPVCLGLYGVMGVCWWVVPRVRKRAE